MRERRNRFWTLPILSALSKSRQDLKIACIEEIAYKRGFIDDAQMEKIINSLKDGVDYKNYLKRVYEDSHEDY